MKPIRFATLLRQRHQHKCYPVNFSKFLLYRTAPGDCFSSWKCDRSNMVLELVVLKISGKSNIWQFFFATLEAAGKLKIFNENFIHQRGVGLKNRAPRTLKSNAQTVLNRDLLDGYFLLYNNSFPYENTITACSCSNCKKM